jgi:hypothetical protein
MKVLVQSLFIVTEYTICSLVIFVQNEWLALEVCSRDLNVFDDRVATSCTEMFPTAMWIWDLGFSWCHSWAFRSSGMTVCHGEPLALWYVIISQKTRINRTSASRSTKLLMWTLCTQLYVVAFGAATFQVYLSHNFQKLLYDRIEKKYIIV